MFFLFWFGSDVKEERRPGGFFACPRCVETRPCDLVRLRRTVKLYSVLPVWTSTLNETRVCQVCGAHDGEPPAPRAGTAPAEAATWRCERCGNVNPAAAPRCLGCGADR